MSCSLKLVIILTILLSIPGFSYADKMTNETMHELLDNPPQPTLFEIEYREIDGAAHTSTWHIGQSDFWIRFHPSDIYHIDKLDKTKQYFITAVILQHYVGTVDVWINKIQDADYIEQARKSILKHLDKEGGSLSMEKMRNYSYSTYWIGPQRFSQMMETFVDENLIEYDNMTQTPKITEKGKEFIK